MLLPFSVDEGEFMYRRSGLLPAKAALASPGSILRSAVHFVHHTGFTGSAPVKLQQFCPVMPLFMSDPYLHALLPASPSTG